MNNLTIHLIPHQLVSDVGSLYLLDQIIQQGENEFAKNDNITIKRLEEKVK